MTEVRWGLLSTARINGSLIPAIRASKRGNLVAIASRDGAKAQAYAARWEIPHAFASYAEMLRSDVVDAVYISLPNHLHAEWSVEALKLGKHVLCEKPLALSVEEVDRMAKASKESQRSLAEGFMYRHHPQTKLAGEWVSDGRLGEISTVSGVFNFALNDPDDIRLNSDFGGGSLWDLGIYPVSFAQFILRSPPVAVTGQQSLGDKDVDETFAGLLRYPEGELAQIASSLRTPEHAHFVVSGTEGQLEIPRPFVDMDKRFKMVFHPKHGDSTEVEVRDKDPFLGEVEDMNAAVLDGAPNYVALQESRDHIRTVQALYQSAQDQRVVHLNNRTKA